MTQDELLALISQAEREEWAMLDLSDQGLEELPLEIGSLSKLEALILETNWDSKKPNKLRQLPPSLFRLSNLRHLDISNNDLISIPAEIGNLSNLQLLLLNNNNLSSIPQEIGELLNLRVSFVSAK